MIRLDRWFVLHAFAVILAILAWSNAAMAQQDSPKDQAPLIVGWHVIPPFYEPGPNGAPIGFLADLANAIAREIGVDLSFQRYPTIEENLSAIRTGDVDFIAGMRSPKTVFPNTIFSDPIGEINLRLHVRADRRSEVDLDSSPPPSVSFPSVFREIARQYLPENVQMSEANSVAEGLIGVISGDVDLFLGSDEGAQSWAFRAGIDHLFAPFGEVISEENRVAILHNSRADLIDPINQAIAQIKEDGTLSALLKKYHMEAYAPPPEVLTLGMVSYPPYLYFDNDGVAHGFGPDLFRDLAAMANLDFRFKEITRADIAKGPNPDVFDAVPLLAILDARRKNWDFTLPVDQKTIGLYVNKNDVDDVSGMQDFIGRKVSVIPSPLMGELTAKVEGVEFIKAGSPRDAMQLLLDGDVDAAVTRSFRFDPEFNRTVAESGFVMVDPPLAFNQRAIALRFGLGDVREKLNTVRPSSLLSERFEALRQKHFGEPVFWTKTRQWIAIGVATGLVVILAIMGFVLAMNLRARRQAEKFAAEMQVISSQLGAVTGAARNGIIGLSPDGSIVFSNPAARRLFGQKPNEKIIAWEKEIQFLSAEDSEPLTPDLNPVRRALQGEILDGELSQMVAAKVGAIRHVRLASSTISQAVTPDIGTVIVFDDVTEEERQREQADRAGRMSAIGQLTGGVAHDFNNLLAVILGNLELIQDEENKEEISKLAVSAIDATMRGADLTQKMLAFARKSRLTPEILDLNLVIRDAKNWIGRTLPETVDVETSLLAGLWKVSVDRSSIESALLNLILNARDAMDARGKLTIETANMRIDEAYIDARGEHILPGRYVMLAVSDDGCGIPAKVIKAVFDPFFTTKGPGEGTGLGLSMVMGFVQQSGGTVQVYSEVGQGASFKVYFPAAKDQDDGDVDETVPLTLVMSEKLRVLLAEDEDSVREVLIKTLEKAGCQVKAAVSGDEAYDIFRKDPNFDLLVTDIVMPGQRQGTDLAKDIRALQRDLPVIFMSGYAKEATVHGNGLRPEDIRLTKPVQRSDLLLAISKATQP